MTRAARFALAVLLLPASLAGCVSSSLPEAMAETTVATRPATVRAMEGLASAAERLPGTLVQVEALLARGVSAGEEVQRTQAALEAGVGRVTSSTAGAIDQLAALAASLERAIGVSTDLLAAARTETDETRAVRLRMLASVADVASSAESLLAHAEETSRTWSQRAVAVRAEEERALHAVADLAEASARVAEHAAALGGTLNRAAGAIEPDVRVAATSAARTLEHVETITGRLAATEMSAGTSEVAWALLGATIMALVLGASVIVRAVFRRAVSREVARLAGPAAA